MIVGVSSRAEVLLQYEENGFAVPNLPMSLAFRRTPEIEIPLISVSYAVNYISFRLLHYIRYIGTNIGYTTLDSLVEGRR